MIPTVITGSQETIRGSITDEAGAPADAAGELSLTVTDPNGAEKVYTLGKLEITRDGVGKYHRGVLASMSGLWHYRWLDAGVIADEGYFEAESEFDQNGAPDLTDLRVLVPQARRNCEGPFGPPAGKPPLTNSVVYGMVADACAEIILFSGTLFRHELLIKKRDPLIGFPTEWKTADVLTPWEGTVIVCQTALDYFFHLFRDLKTSESIKNEGTEWTWELSANVLRNYLETLKDAREKGLEGIRAHNPVLDRYASNIRIRDQATVGILEWWAGATDTGVGVVGGQEAGVIPWTPGWTGEGFVP